MGFVRSAANTATFGLANQLLGKKKKDPARPMPSMISTAPYERPMSLISTQRRG